MEIRPVPGHHRADTTIEVPLLVATVACSDTVYISSVWSGLVLRERHVEVKVRWVWDLGAHFGGAIHAEHIVHAPRVVLLRREVFSTHRLRALRLIFWVIVQV